jgi:hypothetical protein
MHSAELETPEASISTKLDVSTVLGLLLAISASTMTSWTWSAMAKSSATPRAAPLVTPPAGLMLLLRLWLRTLLVRVARLWPASACDELLAPTSGLLLRLRLALLRRLPSRAASALNERNPGVLLGIPRRRLLPDWCLAYSMM